VNLDTNFDDLFKDFDSELSNAFADLDKSLAELDAFDWEAEFNKEFEKALEEAAKPVVDK